MINAISLSNISQILIGIMFSFIIMSMITVFIISKIMKRTNKDEKIREISRKAYEESFLKNKSMKDKLLNSLLEEIKGVSKLAYPEKEHPIFELSINDILKGIQSIQSKIKIIIDNPLCKDIKNIHISTLLDIEQLTKPVTKIFKTKYVKVAKVLYTIYRYTINLLNPVYWIKKVINYTLVKKGKQEIIIMCFDFVGNQAYSMYGVKPLSIENKDKTKTNIKKIKNQNSKDKKTFDD